MRSGHSSGQSRLRQKTDLIQARHCPFLQVGTSKSQSLATPRFPYLYDGTKTTFLTGSLMSGTCSS